MIDACVAELVAKGELSAAQAALYTDTYRELLHSLNGSMSAAAAAARATDDTMKAMAARILQRKRLAGLKYHNRKELVTALRRATEDGVSLTKAVQGLYAHDERMRGVSTPSHTIIQTFL